MTFYMSGSKCSVILVRKECLWAGRDHGADLDCRWAAACRTDLHPLRPWIKDAEKKVATLRDGWDCKTVLKCATLRSGWVSSDLTSLCACLWPFMPDAGSLSVTRWAHLSCAAVSSVCSEREKELSRRRKRGSLALNLQCDGHTYGGTAGCVPGQHSHSLWRSC